MFENAIWITGKETLDNDSLLPPYLFRKSIFISKKVRTANLRATALGCYTIRIGGKKVSNRFFAPGYTQYNKRLFYNEYDVSELLNETEQPFGMELLAEVSGGWYAGRLGLCKDGNRFGDKRAFMMELSIQYADGSEETISTDSSWEVSTDGPRRFADFLNGEIYDARREQVQYWEAASVYRGTLPEKIEKENGGAVIGHDVIAPQKIQKEKAGEYLIDFGRNRAGIVSIGPFEGMEGQEICIRHGEVLKEGCLFTENLRTAKSELHYICKNGEQTYCPEFTYMGFRYISVSGFEPSVDNIRQIELYTELEPTGEFRCSNEDINALHQNILTSLKANFVDIPTDCPQRDERSGWTGDIAVFAPTAAFNMDINDFMKKWTKDLALGQKKNGAIGMIAPDNGLFQKKTDNMMLNLSHHTNDAVWGDAIILVPWAVYQARGDEEILRDNYESMKAWVEFEQNSSRCFSWGDKRYIWSAGFHFGDWLAPGDSIQAGMKKAKWTSTAYFANSARILSEIAQILDHPEDAKRYRELFECIRKAFQKIFVDGSGHIRDGFQSIYVLALQFDLLNEEQRKLALGDLVEDIRKKENHLATGFVATDKILFALSDNGRADVAYDLLLQDSNPSWLYPVRCGATSIWERWDALKPDGTINQNGDMVSFNHYAYGAVGNWLYTRIGGLEPLKPGYREFRIAPIPGGGLTWAEVSYQSSYGKIRSRWEIEENRFKLNFSVPEGTLAHIILPDGNEKIYAKGEHELIIQI